MTKCPKFFTLKHSCPLLYSNTLFFFFYKLLQHTLIIYPLLNFSFFLVCPQSCRGIKLQICETYPSKGEKKNDGEEEALCFDTWDLPWSMVLVQASLPSQTRRPPRHSFGPRSRGSQSQATQRGHFPFRLCPTSNGLHVFPAST